MRVRLQDIRWREYKGQAGDLQTMLVGEYNGISFSDLYTDSFIFQFNFSKWLTRRRILKAINLLHATHWLM